MGESLLIKKQHQQLITGHEKQRKPQKLDLSMHWLGFAKIRAVDAQRHFQATNCLTCSLDIR
ncbi:hypothetical protein CKO40_04520 [Halochromatium glycolicum]|uniref:Uncharacterized protein n=1 Tax=Halochromatium glycolicum TaxID=85075 RepID=A0AAJ0U209_9GAMM|nr:hypothetical protein [Halochromatium glycolicum]